MSSNLVKDPISGFMVPAWKANRIQKTIDVANRRLISDRRKATNEAVAKLFDRRKGERRNDNS